MIEQKEVVVPGSVGSRAAAYLVQTANRYVSAITLQQDDYCADAKSFMGLRCLGMQEGRVMISAEGEDAQNAIGALARLLENGFSGSQSR